MQTKQFVIEEFHNRTPVKPPITVLVYTTPRAELLGRGGCTATAVYDIVPDSLPATLRCVFSKHVCTCMGYLVEDEDAEN